MTSHPTIHRIHISQYIAQMRIMHIVRNQVTGSPEELFAMAEEFITPTPKIEEIHLVGQTVEGFDIIADALCLRRELTDEISSKCFAALWYPVGMSVREIGNTVDTVVIDVAQTPR